MNADRRAPGYGQRSGGASPSSNRHTPSRPRWSGALFLILTGSVASCATPPAPAPEVIRLTPPAALLEPTEIPPYRGRTNGDLAEWAVQCIGAIEEANADKAAIRRWAE